MSELNVYEVLNRKRRGAPLETREIELFLTNPSADDVDVSVKNVTLTELTAPPYRAAIDFEKSYYSQGTRQERKHETYVAQVQFNLRDAVPNAFIRVNPHGMQITNFRVDPALTTVGSTGSNQNAAARVTVQQRVTRNMTITYVSNVGSTQEQVIQVEYNVNRNISIVALRDYNGTFGIDVKIKKRFP